MLCYQKIGARNNHRAGRDGAIVGILKLQLQRRKSGSTFPCHTLSFDLFVLGFGSVKSWWLHKENDWRCKSDRIRLCMKCERNHIACNRVWLCLLLSDITMISMCALAQCQHNYFDDYYCCYKDKAKRDGNIVSQCPLSEPTTTYLVCKRRVSVWIVCRSAKKKKFAECEAAGWVNSIKCSLLWELTVFVVCVACRAANLWGVW